MFSGRVRKPRLAVAFNSYCQLANAELSLILTTSIKHLSPGGEPAGRAAARNYIYDLLWDDMSPQLSPSRKQLHSSPLLIGNADKHSQLAQRNRRASRKGRLVLFSGMCVTTSKWKRESWRLFSIIRISGMHSEGTFAPLSAVGYWLRRLSLAACLTAPSDGMIFSQLEGRMLRV